MGPATSTASPTEFLAQTPPAAGDGGQEVAAVTAA
jgi:hypothetical protein